MKVLGIDPAGVTGFAHSDGYRGSVDLVRATDKHPGQRLVMFRDWLRAALVAHPTDMIAAEDASFGSHNPAVQAKHNELRGVIYLVAAERGIPVKLFGPTTIKKFATNNGRADKKQMVRACKTFYGVDVTDDVADAMFICELAKRQDCWPKQTEKKTKRSKTLRTRQKKMF